MIHMKATFGPLPNSNYKVSLIHVGYSKLHTKHNIPAHPLTVKVSDCKNQYNLLQVPLVIRQMTNVK